MGCEIHSTAIVHPQAELGMDVSIGAYSIIGPNVLIGDASVVGPHAVIDGNTTLGKQNRVFQFASVGSVPQDLKYKGEASVLVIGDRNIIREYVTLQPGTLGGGMRTSIGDGNLFMASSHVGHDSVVGNGNVLANSVALAGHVTVGSHAVFGGMVGVHQFCRIGDYALLAGGSMVGQDIPPYVIAQGDRAVLRGINVVALKRAGFCEADIAYIKRLYRSIFMLEASGVQAIADLPSELTEKEIGKKMIDFCRSSQRGIAPSRKRVSA